MVQIKFFEVLQSVVLRLLNHMSSVRQDGCNVTCKICHVLDMSHVICHAKMCQNEKKIETRTVQNDSRIAVSK